MGKIDQDFEPRPFTEEDIRNKDLIIKMLKFEDSIILGPMGASIYANPFYNPRISLEPYYAMHREVLTHFGFDTQDYSVDNYRKIFSHYYKSATEYDNEVLSSVTYMRENKCVYYTKPEIKVNDIIPDVALCDLDGQRKTTIAETLGNDFDYAFVAGFSSS